MKRHLTFAALSAMGLLGAGCANDDKIVLRDPVVVVHPGDEEVPVYASDTGEPSGDRLLNLGKLENVPPAVRQAFLRQHPDGAITDITVLNAATGRAVWEITFIRNGRADRVRYTTSGAVVPIPAASPDGVAPPPTPSGQPGLR